MKRRWAAAARDEASKDEADDLAGCALDTVDPRQDVYHTCQRKGMFLTREAMIARQEVGPVIVVDTRDDDVIGGMISGALHLPDGTWASTSGALESVHIILDKARESASPKVCVVFHCMESVRRGPRCAYRLALATEALAECGVVFPTLDIRVLEGGFDRWVRQYWKDNTKVTGFDDDYWLFSELEELREQEAAKVQHNIPNLKPGAKATGSSSGDSGGGGGGNGSKKGSGGGGSSNRLHTLYSRPKDQPATPWSAAGQDALPPPSSPLP
jgi:hypothetical protein